MQIRFIIKMMALFLLFYIGSQKVELFAEVCCKRDYLYIRNAKISTSEEIQKFKFLKERKKTIKPLLEGHYISPGNNLVILIREFDCGRTSTIDDELFRKMTIEIEKYISYISLDLSSPTIKVNYSNGSSAWAFRTGGAYSSTGTGKIKIIDLEENMLLLEVDVKLLCKLSKESFPKNKTIQKIIKKEYILKESSIDELTPWLGVPDPSWDPELYAE